MRIAIIASVRAKGLDGCCVQRRKMRIKERVVARTVLEKRRPPPALREKCLSLCVCV